MSEKKELTTLRLFSPLRAGLYIRDEWGVGNSPVELAGAELCAYEDKIRELIARERLDSEGERGLEKEFDQPYLKKEMELARHYLPPPDFEEIQAILLKNAEVTDVKRAAAFFKLIRYSYGSGCTSYGCQPFDVRKCFDAIWQASYRLANTVVENKDFEALIRQYDRESAFFYCDPPYYETEGHYEVVFRKEDHKRLRDTLAAGKGKWMVSYNDCAFIRDLYAGYTITAVTRINNLAQRYDGGCEFPEVIITNYDPRERANMEPHQLNLFDLGTDDGDDCYQAAGQSCPESEET